MRSIKVKAAAIKILLFDKNCYISILIKKEPFFQKHNYFTLPHRFLQFKPKILNRVFIRDPLNNRLQRLLIRRILPVLNPSADQFA